MGCDLGNYPLPCVNLAYVEAKQDQIAGTLGTFAWGDCLAVASIALVKRF